MFFHSQPRLLRLILEQEWDSVIFHVAQHPKEARRWSKVLFDSHRETTLLPLHQACALAPPTTAVLEALLAAYPEAISQIESYFERTPLHLACVHGASTDILCYLISKYPKAASSTDKMGRTPLHYAICDHAPLEAILELLRVSPQSATVQDAKGWLPIHVACRYGATREGLEALIYAYPESLQVKTIRCGMTPLICAQKFGILHQHGLLELLER